MLKVLGLHTLDPFQAQNLRVKGYICCELNCRGPFVVHALCSVDLSVEEFAVNVLDIIFLLLPSLTTHSLR